LSRIVYKTCGEEDDETEYVELLLGFNADSVGQVYVQNKWHKDPTNKQEYVVYDTIVPKLNGEPLVDIPFWFISTTYGSNEIKKSPVADLADVNVSHYNTQADLEHARFFLGFPQAVLAGFNLSAGTVVAIGSQQILQAPDGNAKWGYLEFTGQGLQSLTDAATQKEDMMAKLGARLLMDDKKVAETAEAARIKASGQACVLAGIANSVSHSMTEVLKFMLQWAGHPSPTAEVKLNTEYAPTNMSAADLLAFTDALIKGALPKYDYFIKLRSGGVIEEDRTFEDYEAETDDLTPGSQQLDSDLKDQEDEPAEDEDKK